MTSETSSLRVRLDLVVERHDDGTVQGSCRHGDDTASYWGWLELLAAIESALDRAKDPQGHGRSHG